MNKTTLLKGYKGSLYGSYRQLKFSDVYYTAEDFLTDYKTLGLPTTISEANVTTLYYLLYGKYGNSTVASSDINRFKYRLFSLVFQHAPVWAKKLDIQERLRNLSEDELLTGSRQIYNAALNPSVEPSTDTTDELQYINSQNVTKNRKGKLEGYALLYELLKEDVTEAFLNKFKSLFLTIVEPEEPLLYITEEDEEND